MEIILLIIWLLGLILFTTIGSIIGVKYGVEYLTGMFVVSLILANIMAPKIINIGGLTVSAAVVIYAMSFLLSDSISEFFGKKRAKHAIYLGLYGLVFMVFFIQTSMLITPVPYWGGQEAFNEVFSLNLRVAIASLLAFFIAQSHDVWAFHFWKKQTKGKHLWFRNNASTLISQILDTVIFVVVAFYGIFPVLPIIIGGIVSKGIIAIIDTPFLYIIRNFVKK